MNFQSTRLFLTGSKIFRKNKEAVWNRSTAKIAILLQAAQVVMYNVIEQRRKGKIYESSFNKEDLDDLLHRGMTQYKGISWSKQ